MAVCWQDMTYKLHTSNLISASFPSSNTYAIRLQAILGDSEKHTLHIDHSGITCIVFVRPAVFAHALGQDRVGPEVTPRHNRNVSV